MAQNFKISVDDQELEKAFDSLEKKASSLEHTMAELGKNVDDVFAVDDISKYTSSLQEASDMINLLTEARKKQYQEYHNLKFDKDTFGIVTDEEVNKSLHNLNLLDSAIKELEQAVSIMSDSKVDFDKVGVSGLDKQAESLKRYARMIDELVDSQDKAEMKLASFMENITEDTSIKDITKAQEQYIASLESISYRLEAITVKGQDDLSANQVKEIQNITKRINEELAYSKARIAEIGKETDNTTTKAKTYYTQIREIREEMASLVSSDGTIPKENIQRYDELKDKLSELGTAYRRVQQEQKLVTQAGSSMVAGITQGLQAIAGTFTLVQGVSAMFTDDAEKIQEIQKKLQTAMAITMGIQQVSTALHATSNLRIGLVAKATTLWDTAQKALNTSLGIGAGLSKAFLTGGVMALVVGVGYLVTQYSKWSAEQKKISDLANSYLETTAKEVIEVNRLFNALQGATKESKEYANIKKEIKSKYGEYLANQREEVKNLNDETEARKVLTKAVLETAKAKGLEDATSKASSKFAKDWSNALDDIYVGFKDKFGDDGSKMFAQFSSDLIASGGILTDDMKKVYGDVTKTMIQQTSQFGTYTTTQVDLLNPAVDKAKKAFDEYSTTLDFNNSLFKSNTAETEKYIGLLGIQQQKLEELETKFGDVSQIRDESVLKQYNQEKKRIEEEIKRLSSLGVETIKPPKQSKEESDYSKVIKDQITQLNKEREELEKQGIEGKIKLLQYEAQKELDIISKVKDEAIRLGKEADVSMLEERERTLTQYYENLIQKETNATEEANKRKLDEYKSYEEKRVDLIEKYNKDIDLAKSLGFSDDTIIRMREKLESELSKLDFANLMDTSDIGSLFEDLDKKSSDSIKAIIAKLKELRDANANSWDVTEIKAFNDQISKGEALLENRSPFKSLTSGIEEYKAANIELEKQKKILLELEKEGSEDLEGQLKTIQAIKNAEDARAKAQDKINKSVKEVGKTISDASSAMTDVTDMLSNFGVEFDESINQAIKGIGQMGDALANLDVTKPGSIITSSIKWMSGIGNIIGGLFGGSKKEVSEKQLKEYQATTEAIERLIQAQKNLMEYTSGELAKKSADEAIELLNKQKAATRELYHETVDSYGGRSRTIGYRMAKDMKPFRDEIRAIGLDWDAMFSSGRMEGLVWLSGEELAKLRDEVPKAWAAIDDEVKKYLESIIAADEMIAKIPEELKDVFTGTDFESFLSSVANEVNNFKGDIESLGDFTEDTIKKSLFNAYKQSVLRNAMMPLYDELADIMSKDIDKISDTEVEDWSKKLQNAIEFQNQDLKDKLQKLGIDLDKEEMRPKASQGYQVQMSQETGDEISGMVRGMQMTLLNQESEMIKQTDIFSSFGMQFGNMQQELQAISNATLQGVYYLQDIEKHTRVLPSFSDKLDKIEQNTR